MSPTTSLSARPKKVRAQLPVPKLTWQSFCPFLPRTVFTIADINEFRTNNAYVERVIEALYDYLLWIDEVRGTGRLYLP